MSGYAEIHALLAALSSADRRRRAELLAATPATKAALLRRAGFAAMAAKWQRKADALTAKNLNIT